MATEMPKLRNMETKYSVFVLSVSRSVMSFDPNLAKLLGRNIQPGQKLDFMDVFNPCDYEKVTSAFSETIRTGRATGKLNAYVVSGAGNFLPASVSIRPLISTGDGIVGAVISIGTKGLSDGVTKKIAESSRHVDKSPAENQSLLEALPEGVFTIDTNWKISSFNNMAEEITGFSREMVLGKRCKEVFRSDVCNNGCPLRSALENGHSCIDQDVRIIDKGGGKQTLLVNAGVLRDKNGEVIGAVETFRPLTGVFCIRRGSFDDYVFDNIVGRSAAMKNIFSMLPDVAASDANVLLSGESGTGKDLFANTIHNHSSRRNAPFVAVNCAALAESLLESELFGHEKASFTGAEATKKGRFELVKNGTLFLDEIGELKPGLQIKLLRVLEQREFERVGGEKSISMDARIVSATNRNLKKALKRRDFREDFYFRLRTIPITLPPLRERREDIPLLVDFFIRRLNFHTRKCVRVVSPKVMRFFMDYSWPGNVRELQRTLEYAFVFVKGSVIQYRDLPREEEFNDSPAGLKTSSPFKNQPFGRETILWAIDQSNGKRNEAAKLLGMSRTSLWRRMKELRLL